MYQAMSGMERDGEVEGVRSIIINRKNGTREVEIKRMISRKTHGMIMIIRRKRNIIRRHATHKNKDHIRMYKRKKPYT